MTNYKLVLLTASMSLGFGALVGCDNRFWPDPVREKQEKQAQVVAGRDNEGLKIRVDDLDHRARDEATAVDKRFRELERRIERLEQGLPPVRQ